MSYDNAVAQTKFRSFKTRLSRVLNKKDWHGVLREAKAFRDYYASSAEPMPDDWHRWQRAADDAFFALRREGGNVEQVQI